MVWKVFQSQLVQNYFLVRILLGGSLFQHLRNALDLSIDSG